MLTRRKREKAEADEVEVLNKVRKEGSKENPFLNGDIIEILGQNAGVGELAGLREVSAQYHDAMSKPFFDKLAKTVVINPNGSMRLAWIETVNTIRIPRDKVTWANRVSKRKCLTLRNWNSDLAKKFQVSTILIKDYDFPGNTAEKNFNPELEQLLQTLQPTVTELRFDYLKYRYQNPILPLPISKFIRKFKNLESIQLTFVQVSSISPEITPQDILEMIKDVDSTVEILILFEMLSATLEVFKTFLKTFSAYSNVKIDFQRVQITHENIGYLTPLVQEHSDKLVGFGLYIVDSFPPAHVIKTQLGLLSPYLTYLQIAVRKNCPDFLSGLSFPKLKSLHMTNYNHPIGFGGILPNCPLLHHLWLCVDQKGCIFITDGEENEFSDLQATFASLEHLEELKFYEYMGSVASQKILRDNKYHRYLKKLLPRCKVIVKPGLDWSLQNSIQINPGDEYVFMGIQESGEEDSDESGEEDSDESGEEDSDESEEVDSDESEEVDSDESEEVDSDESGEEDEGSADENGSGDDGSADENGSGDDGSADENGSGDDGSADENGSGDDGSADENVEQQ